MVVGLVGARHRLLFLLLAQFASRVVALGIDGGASGG